MVATAFDLHPTDIPTLSIVDARNIMHKVSSKMIEPSILQEIETRAQNVLGTFAFALAGAVVVVLFVLVLVGWLAGEQI